MPNQRIPFVDPAIFDLPLGIENRFPPELVFDPKWLIICNIKILIITDSGLGGFTLTEGFHLGQILKILKENPWSHINFEVTKAHRETSNEDDVIDNFRFDSHDLSQYSQIWLFGITSQGGGTAMTSSELRELSKFMDAGGGVFATGDHESLGNPLAAEVLRVRSMRRWYYPDSGPNGEPVAPSREAPNGHDTIVNFGMGGNQTDPDPQEINPVLYSITLPLGSVGARVFRYPHPVLCSSNGVINYLPDHMHEGECEVPSNLNNSWSFGGQTFVEYPEKNGHQQRPEVIAFANNNLSANQFGVLGAYDGHQVEVGRVLVDATWHHWFNINTLPYINASNPEHPTYKPETVPKWEEIKAYYRNVAVWLARPSLQRCIRNGGWIRVLGDLEISVVSRELQTDQDPLLYYWQLGILARDALGRGASQCQTVRWILDLIFPELFEPPFTFPIDPWRQPRPNEQLIDPPRGFDFTEFETVAIGAAVHAAHRRFSQTVNPQSLIGNDEGLEVEEVLREGMIRGFTTCSNHFEESSRITKQFLRQICEK